MRVLIPLLLLVVATGCAPRKIPGTDLDDTDDTRAVLDVLQKYRSAVEKKDTDTIVKLADETFRDDGGSANPDDDLDYASLGPKLTARLAKIANVKLLASPADGAKALATLPKGEELVVVGEEKDGFINVQSGSATGWVKKVLVVRP